ncbi:MAG: riboflavin biosynthesis protein RibF [Alphaproteobacteria bacterium]
MHIFKSCKISEEFLNSTIAIGNFDGVHIGHQAVINKAKEISKKKQTKLGVLTFEPHPKCYFNKKNNFFRLTPFREKFKILKQTGLDFMINLKFNRAFLKTSALDFLKNNLVDKLRVSNVVTGFDFVFGNNQIGNVSFIKKFAEETRLFNFFMVPEVKTTPHIEVSSSSIRNFIRQGKIEEANSLLTRNWQISGRVAKGEKKAREIGFRTANIKAEKFCDILYGVYMVSVKFDNKITDKIFLGIANYGIKPTFNKKSPLLEVHIFDFNNEIYNERISVIFHKFIRPEKKFESIVKLKDQIIKDINKVKNERLL